MTMLKAIVEDIDWRVAELASLRTIPFRYRIDVNHVDILIRYIIPAIYALWEGFVKKSFITYSEELNSLKLQISNVHENLLTHALTIGTEFDLNCSRSSFDAKKRYIKAMKLKYTTTLMLTYEIPTKSNVNFDVINDILMRFNLNSMDKKYKKPLNKLLRFRNEVAHGERVTPIRKENIEEFVNLVQDLMLEIYDRIEFGFNTKTYLKN